ncbi:PD-(D/E)XK nuclease domain-containing protein [[Eubacterium] hominis]
MIFICSYFQNAKDTDFENLYNAFETANEKLFTTTYRNILETLPSSFDLKDENSYHMMVLGLCAWMRNIYEVESNREEGLGRGDIVLIAKRNDIPSYVLEFKYSKEECDLDQLANVAIQQIIYKKYDMKLKDKIIYIGLAHHKKSVKVKWINKD